MVGSLVALVLWATGCSAPPAEVAGAGVVEAPGARAAPAADPAGPCADVGDARVCWGGETRLEPRPLPPGPAPAAGWRCFGDGAARSCADRARGAGPFVCEGARCLQRQPRLPDDGEWECADLGDAVVCHGGEPASGVHAGPPDPGWLCGAAPVAARGRICVDLSPDRPFGDARGWRCRYLHEHGEKRSCVRDASAPAPAAACGGAGDRPCGRGTSCLGGRCLPGRPEPACWVDADCAGGAACVLGSCTG